MWAEQATADECLDCRKPFSFYFDLVAAHWLSKSPPSNNLTLHRICTLARKQGACFVVVESALQRPDVREEIDALDSHNGGGGSSSAVLFSFFAGERTPDKIASVSEQDFIGTAVLINYKPANATEYQVTYIFEAIIAPPRQLDESGRHRNLLNNFICRDAPFRRTIRGREFSIKGFYYCQQNSQTHVCAHACLRMAINSDGDLARPALTATAINKHLSIAPPLVGLTIAQIKEIIHAQTGVDPMISDCTKGQKKADYLSVLTSLIESGCIVLLVFTTANSVEHVVTVFGYTRNSDEWHPQAIPGYSGPQSAQYFSSSSWVDHFVIHDDNLGPYYTLSSRALEVDQNITAHWIIAIHPHEAKIAPTYAEALGSIFLRSALPMLQGEGKWFDYISANQFTYVMRAVLINREAYLQHLKESVAHDGTTMSEAEIALFSGIPDWIWMVEFSLPSLFTGNRSKLGEVLVATTPGSAPADILLAVRVPSVLVLKDSGGQGIANPSGIKSHSPFFVYRPHDNQW